MQVISIGYPVAPQVAGHPHGQPAIAQDVPRDTVVPKISQASDSANLSMDNPGAEGDTSRESSTAEKVRAHIELANSDDPEEVVKENANLTPPSLLQLRIEVLHEDKNAKAFGSDSLDQQTASAEPAEQKASGEASPWHAGDPAFSELTSQDDHTLATAPEKAHPSEEPMADPTANNAQAQYRDAILTLGG